MASQKSPEELLEIFETLDCCSLKEKTAEFLPDLINSLGVEDDSCRAIKVLRVLLNSCLPVIRIEHAEKKIFQHAFPALKHLFHETLNGIQFKLKSEDVVQPEEVTDDLDGLLKVCLILLECVDSALQYIVSSSQIRAGDIPSVSKNVADILLYSFKHCKESTNMYGSFFQPLSETLGLLFKTSHAIQGRFITALTSNIKYDCSYEEDLDDLVNVLEVMEEIAEVVTGLDIKTMANQWKFYAKVLQENVAHLKQRIEVCRPIKFLSSDLRTGLQAILELDTSDSKSVVRDLKLLNFTLKILMLICETYVGYLGDCHKELVHLILYLLSNSHPYLRVMQFPKTIIDAVESYVIVGVEPLVMRLVEERGLAEEYFRFHQSVNEKESMKLGFLLFSVMLIKNILSCDNKIREAWLKNDSSENIISAVFQAVGCCHLELSQDLLIKGSCKGPTSGGSGVYHGVYESLIVHLSALITTVPTESMPLVEKTLLDNILCRNGSFWPALIAADVWCMIARCGSAELCFKHVGQLTNISKSLLQDRGGPETMYLRMVLRRLFSLLSNKGMVQMCERYPPVTNPRLWHIFDIKKLPEQLRLRVRFELITQSMREIENFISNPSNIHLYHKMMDAVVGAAVGFNCSPLEKNDDLGCQYASEIVKVWASICPSRIPLESSNSQAWLNRFFSDLTSATSCIASILSNAHILQVLHVLLHEKLQTLHSVKLATLKFLRDLAVLFLDCDPYQARVCQQIAKAFSLLLQDRNAIIRQLSLEAFTYFSQVTKHEQIVPMSVGSNQKVKDEVADCLRKVPHQIFSGEKVSFEDFLRKQSTVEPSHICGLCEVKSSVVCELPIKSFQVTGQVNDQHGDQRHKEAKLLRACDDDGASPSFSNEMEIDFKSKKRKVDDSLVAVIKRMKDDLAYIMNEHKKETLPNYVKTEIQEIVCQLQSLVS